MVKVRNVQKKTIDTVLGIKNGQLYHKVMLLLKNQLYAYLTIVTFLKLEV